MGYVSFREGKYQQDIPALFFVLFGNSGEKPFFDSSSLGGVLEM